MSLETLAFAGAALVAYAYIPQIAHIIAISFIVVFSYFHQEKICEEHKHKFL